MEGVSLSTQVFVCHASVEADHAFLLERLLEERGLASWIGPRDVPVGSDYASEIPAALKGSAAVALLFSARSSTSPDCQREIALAIEYRVPIYAIRLDATPIDGSWTYRLKTIQWRDGTAEDLADIVAARHGLNQALGAASLRAMASGDTAVEAPSIDDVDPSAYRASIEYAAIHLDSQSGSVEVAASNRAHGGDRPHRRGTPTDDEWSDSVFSSVADPVLVSSRQWLRCWRAAGSTISSSVDRSSSLARRRRTTSS